MVIINEHVSNKIQEFADWLASVVDSELVTFYQMVFYTLIFLNGLYTVCFVDIHRPDAAVVSLIETLTPDWYFAFFWLSVVAPALTIMGKAMRGRFGRGGAVFQLTGDVGFSGLCWTYCVAIYFTSFWGRSIFSTLFVLAAGICTSLFIFRDVRRLREKDRWVKV